MTAKSDIFEYLGFIPLIIVSRMNQADLLKPTNDKKNRQPTNRYDVAAHFSLPIFINRTDDRWDNECVLSGIIHAEGFG